MPPVGPDDVRGGAGIGPDGAPIGHGPLPFPQRKVEDAAVRMIFGHIVDLCVGAVAGEDLEIFQLVVEAGLEMTGLEFFIVFICQLFTFDQRTEPDGGENEDDGQEERGDGLLHGITAFLFFGYGSMGICEGCEWILKNCLRFANEVSLARYEVSFGHEVASL